MLLEENAGIGITGLFHFLLPHQAQTTQGTIDSLMSRASSCALSAVDVVQESIVVDSLDLSEIYEKEGYAEPVHLDYAVQLRELTGRTRKK